MSIPKTTIRAAVLATTLFNLLLFSKENIDRDIVWVIPISFFIFLLISFFAIIITVSPFNNEDKESREIFHKYFPYYSILLFISVFSFSYINDFESFTLLVSITTFFTANAAWVWYYKNIKHILT
jgi:hypothetical protein